MKVIIVIQHDCHSYSTIIIQGYSRDYHYHTVPPSYHIFHIHTSTGSCFFALTITSEWPINTDPHAMLLDLDPRYDHLTR